MIEMIQARLVMSLGSRLENGVAAWMKLDTPYTYLHADDIEIPWILLGLRNVILLIMASLTVLNHRLISLWIIRHRTKSNK